MDQKQELLTLSARSCLAVSNLFPAPRHLLSFSLLSADCASTYTRSRTLSLSSRSVVSAESLVGASSALFDCDAVGQFDMQMHGAASDSLLAVTCAFARGQQVVTFEPLVGLSELLQRRRLRT